MAGLRRKGSTDSGHPAGCWTSPSVDRLDASSTSAAYRIAEQDGFDPRVGAPEDDPGHVPSRVRVGNGLRGCRTTRPPEGEPPHVRREPVGGLVAVVDVDVLLSARSVVHRGVALAALHPDLAQPGHRADLRERALRPREVLEE